MAAVPRRLKRIEVYCPEYQTTATIRINDAHSSGTDPLEVDYKSPDHSHFTIEIPDDWTDQDLLELIFLPPRDPGRQNWPAWEIPAYDLVSSKLFRFWKGEKNQTSELGFLSRLLHRAESGSRNADRFWVVNGSCHGHASVWQ
jgi:hypothetical protein